MRSLRLKILNRGRTIIIEVNEETQLPPSKTIQAVCTNLSSSQNPGEKTLFNMKTRINVAAPNKKFAFDVN